MSQSPPSSIVSCPFCGYPYPMSEMRREIYIGRNMGCMNCGRPFKVDAPPPAPDPVASAGPAAGDTSLTGPDDPAGATAGISPARVADESSLATSPAAAASATEVPARGANATAPRPNPAALIGFGFALLFFVLIAAATIASAVASDTEPNTGGGYIPRTPPGILAALAIASAVLAVLVSAAGLVRVRWIVGPRGPVGTAGRGLSIAGLTIGGVGLLITALVLSTVMPVMNRQREMARRDQCKANLQQIASALANYANGNGGHYPDSLAPLVANGSLATSALVCPSTTDHPADGANPAAQAAALSQPGHQSYIYAGKGFTSASATHTVLVYEPPDDHGDVAHVLFLDGYILPVQRGSAEQLRRELDTGQNPSPTAKLLRP